MQIEIKNRWTNEVMHSGEYVDLRAAVVSVVENGAYLRSAYLRGADLWGADLRGAYLRGADLRGADLRGADLQGADLLGADLQGADLQGADLRGADLQGADLRGADLRGADLQGAKNAELAMSKTLIVPQGELRVWKQCKNKVLVHISVPHEARRSNATGRKCRAEFVDVLSIEGAEVGISKHDGKTEYRVGQRVTCDKWDDDRWNECSGGIHFYLTREEALAD